MLGNKKIFYGILLAFLIGFGVIYFIILNRVVIKSISPTSGSIGTEIVIRGSGFTQENNDIAFTQGGNTGYLNKVASPDGKALRFNLPEELGVCPFSQMKPNEICPAIAMLLPTGDIQIAVVNRNGRSNSVVFERKKSESEKAKEIIYNSSSYQELTKILDEMTRRTGGFTSSSVDECDGKICIKVWIEKDVPELRQKIPTKIEGFDVKIEKWLLNN